MRIFQKLLVGSLLGLYVGTIASNALAQPVEPVIRCHPESQLVALGTNGTGTNVTFSVAVEPRPPVLAFPFTYQWEMNYVMGASNFFSIAGATNSTYTIPHPVTTNDVAFYRVVVTGVSNSVTSEPASLFVWQETQSFTVTGPTYVYPGYSANTCPGPYIGFVCFPGPGNAGWIPLTGVAREARDPNRSNTKVEFCGRNDVGCATSAVSIVDKTGSALPASDRYLFAIYFVEGYVPYRGYSIRLTGFQPP